ncbi:MAG TPA: HGxxPAAW family protein [Pedococcus sp.]|jgi:multisubunit Na+/H+ antiporter MnhG subunit|nr:HGxxPAAW family protein [Pedococcus sp.]
MSEHEIDEDHGHSVAAWTGVLVILVGSALASLAVVITNVPLFVVGIVVCILGVVAGKLLSMAGYGTKVVDGPDSPESNRPEVGIG